MKFTYQDTQKQRLDKFLNDQLSAINRSQIKKIILGGQVLVNDQKPTVHHWLKTGEVITFNELPRKTKYKGKILKPKVIEQTDDYLIIEKPAGLLVHPTDQKEDNTLANWLVKNYPEIKTVGDDPIRPGIMHRLDKEASGLMVVALNQPSFNSLKKQFQQRKVSKEYLVLIYGKMLEETGQINTPLERHKKTGLMVAQTTLASGKPAQTNYEVLTHYLNHTLLKIHTTTGRQHQIRAHLYSIGHSVVGDKLYVTKDLRKKIAQGATRLGREKTINDVRLFLHAHLLKFKDRKNHWQEYHSPLPKELKNFLTTTK
jgi:23S rRNA pseudouridine1911/1915/1917 synthase